MDEWNNWWTYMFPDVLQPLLHFHRAIPFRNEEFVLDDARLLFACFSGVSCVANFCYFDRILNGIESWVMSVFSVVEGLWIGGGMSICNEGVIETFAWKGLGKGQWIKRLLAGVIIESVILLKICKLCILCTWRYLSLDDQGCSLTLDAFGVWHVRRQLTQ